MIDRFLRYSKEHARKIKVAYLDAENAVRHDNITVIDCDADTVYYLTSRRKTPQSLPVRAILAAGYARGDEGDTYVNALKEGKE